MVDIQSKEVIDQISEELRVQPALMIPRVLSKDIQLVYEVLKRERAVNIFDTNGASTTGTITLFTVPSRERGRFFLTHASLDVTSDVSADNTTTFMSMQTAPNDLFSNIARNIIELPKQTLTVTTSGRNIDFNTPVELAPNTNVTMTNTFTAGASRMNGIVLGFFIPAS